MQQTADWNSEPNLKSDRRELDPLQRCVTMSQNSKTDIPLNRRSSPIALIFYGVLLTHLIIWTVLPGVVRYSLSHDAVEALVWAQHLQWGYDKNPYFIGWVTRLGIEFGGAPYFFGYYFIQQAFIILGLWSLWRLALDLFESEFVALVAVLVLEACLYFTVYVLTNNDNFPLIGLLAFSVWTFYRACNTNGLGYWIISGLAFGLALMSKYSAVLYVMPMLLYVAYLHCTQKNTISPFKTPGLYVGIGVIVLLCIPNLIWLESHQWISFQYLLTRKQVGHPSFYDQHVYYTLDFLNRSFQNILPCLVLFLFALPVSLIKAKALYTKQAMFTLILGLLPFVIVVCLAFVQGWQLYWEWGVPFVFMLGLLLVLFFRPKATRGALIRFSIATFVIIALTATGYVLDNVKWGAGKGSGDYPADTIANYATQLWQQRYHRKLEFVAGSRYTAGYVAAYSQDHPKVFVEWNNLYSPGVTEKQMKKTGGIFIQDGYYGTPVIENPAGYSVPSKFPTSILKRFPNLIVLPVKVFKYHRNAKSHHVVNVLIGLLPPQKS